MKTLGRYRITSGKKHTRQVLIILLSISLAITCESTQPEIRVIMKIRPGNDTVYIITHENISVQDSLRLVKELEKIRRPYQIKRNHR